MTGERNDPDWSLLEQVLAVVSTHHLDAENYVKRFLEQVLAVVSTRRAQQEFSKYETAPIKTTAEAVKTAIAAMFFRLTMHL